MSCGPYLVAVVSETFTNTGVRFGFHTPSRTQIGVEERCVKPNIDRKHINLVSKNGGIIP